MQRPYLSGQLPGDGQTPITNKAWAGASHECALQSRAQANGRGEDKEE